MEGEPTPTRPLRSGDHVVVVGAGPAGLTAAHELTARDDVRVTVLEAIDTVGGISRTAEYHGYRFDIGGHLFFTKLDAVQEMWEEVLGDEFLTVPRLSRIYYDGRFFRYPRLGPGQMWERTRDRVRDRGGTVLMEHRVTAIRHRDGRAVGVVAETPEGERRFEADHVVSSMPVRSLVRSLEPAPDERFVAAAEELRYRDFENWSEDMVPDVGRTCLGMEYFCFEGDGLWTADDRDLLRLAARELERLGLAGGAEVLDGTVVRMPKAYPIYDRDYRGRLETVRQQLSRITNLHPVGRNGMHKYNNQDHSMLTAMMSVWNMEGTSYDVWAVNTGFEYLEEQKIGQPDRTLRPDFAGGGRDTGGEGTPEDAEPDLVQATG